MAEYSIKDLERLSGIKAHTIRMWEKRYDLISPSRSCLNIRCYCEKELKHLLNIALLNKHGHKISKIAELGRSGITHQVKLLLTEDQPMLGYIDGLTKAMVDMDKALFEQTIAECSEQYGFEQTCIGVVYPFLQKAGVLWQLDSVNAAQQHFVKNLIRQKLMVAIDRIPVPKVGTGKSYLLFLKEGETHEIGLLFYHILIAQKGHTVIYLGANVPVSEVLEVAKWHKPDVLVTSINNRACKKEITNYISSICSKLENTQFLILGEGGSEIDSLPSGAHILPTIGDMKNRI